MDGGSIEYKLWSGLGEAWCVIYKMLKEMPTDHPERDAINQLLGEINETECLFNKYV